MTKVIAGKGPSPDLVMAAVRALPPESMTAALSAGGRDHYGWNLTTHLLANIYDAINLNTRATGNWGKKKPPTFPEHPRPKSKPQQKSDAPPRKVTVRDIFSRIAAGKV